VRGAALAGVLLVGCVGTGEGLPNLRAAAPGEAPTTYAEIQAQVFDPLCAAQCHQGGAAPKGLSLEAGRSLRGLVGVASVEVPGLLRVLPGDPEGSYLVVKLAASDARRVGARMPRNGPPFASDAQVRAIKQWIREGAAEDWEAGASGEDAAFQPPTVEGDAAVPDAAVPDAAAVEEDAT
jgi:hypothetical protein